MLGFPTGPPERAATADGRVLLCPGDLDRIKDHDGTPLTRSGHAILAVDDEGRYIGATTAALVLLEYELSELCTKTVADLTAPDQQGLYADVWKHFEESGRGSGFYAVVTGTGRTLPIRYDARSNVLPGIHLSHIQPI